VTKPALQGINFLQVTLEHDRHLTNYFEEWTRRFNEESDPGGMISFQTQWSNTCSFLCLRSWKCIPMHSTTLVSSVFQSSARPADVPLAWSAIHVLSCILSDFNMPSNEAWRRVTTSFLTRLVLLLLHIPKHLTQLYTVFRLRKGGY